MEHVLLGGHPAIDFLNTSLAPDGERIEKIPDGRAWLDWLTAAGLLDEARALKVARRFGADALDASAAEARKAREWARDWLGGWPRKGTHLVSRNKLRPLSRLSRAALRVRFLGLSDRM